MKIRQLLNEWENNAKTPVSAQEYTVRLPLPEAARIAALAEMYPGRTTTQIITDLLAAALDELESSLPYVTGSRVIAEDDHGDPIYEDAGPTPRFHELTQHHLQRLAGAARAAK